MDFISDGSFLSTSPVHMNESDYLDWSLQTDSSFDTSVVRNFVWSGSEQTPPLSAMQGKGGVIQGWCPPSPHHFI